MKSSFTIRYHHDIVVKPLKVAVSVVQNGVDLYKRTIDLRCMFSPLRIEFEFDSLSTLQLTFKTNSELIHEFPLYIDRIEFDDLLDIPLVAHSGSLVNSAGKLEIGNCLYDIGPLIYNFALPLSSNCKIV